MRPPALQVRFEALQRRAHRWHQAYWDERRRADRALERMQPDHIAGMLGEHRYVMGGGRNSNPDICSCGAWSAKSLTDVERNDYEWRCHVAYALCRDEDPHEPHDAWGRCRFCGDYTEKGDDPAINLCVRCANGGMSDGSPKDGHTWVIRILSRMASSVIQADGSSGDYRDANWSAWHKPVVVRAHDLPAALRIAAALPLDSWHSEDDDPDPIEEPPDA